MDPFYVPVYCPACRNRLGFVDTRIQGCTMARPFHIRRPDGASFAQTDRIPDFVGYGHCPNCLYETRGLALQVARWWRDFLGTLGAVTRKHLSLPAPSVVM